LILILSIIIYKGFRALEGCIRRGEGVVEGRRLHLQREGACRRGPAEALIAVFTEGKVLQRQCRGPTDCTRRGEGVAEGKVS